MASVEERFQAAVNVIKGLPKNGPYQPSTSMMLKFYGYYKQATEGPCQQSKPGFWDVIGRTKWEAWNDNRHLTKQQAMQRYVENLREIIETMSFTENVQNFVGSISGLDNINLDELEMIAPGMREIAESHPNSPFHSRTNSPQHGLSSNSDASSLHSESRLDVHNANHLNGDEVTNCNEDTENSTLTIPVSDQLTIADGTIMPKTFLNSQAPVSNVSNFNIDQSDDEYGDPVDVQSEFTEAIINNSELLKQIQTAVQRMNADLVSINQRMGSLEKTLHDVRATVQPTDRRNSINNSFPKWWPFKDISPTWFVILVLWPLVVNRILHMARARRPN